MKSDDPATVSTSFSNVSEICSHFFISEFRSIIRWWQHPKIHLKIRKPHEKIAPEKLDAPSFSTIWSSKYHSLFRVDISDAVYPVFWVNGFPYVKQDINDFKLKTFLRRCSPMTFRHVFKMCWFAESLTPLTVEPSNQRKSCLSLWAWEEALIWKFIMFFKTFLQDFFHCNIAVRTH